MEQCQPNLTPMMRAILVDWLIDVGTHFDLSQETLHLAVIYTDLTLQSKAIEKNNLQLIGVTSMKMAE
jgi:cyclin-A